MNVNVDERQMGSPELTEDVFHLLQNYKLPASCLRLEVTESVFLDRGSHHVLRALTKLSEHGVRIALDDFGTGFASLTHLKKFPVDVLKIDQTFVAGLGKSADDAAIVRALIGLGNSLGMETVAEGIETKQQAAFVRTCGCTLGQGYLYGAARPAADIPQLINTMGHHKNIVPFQKMRPSVHTASHMC